LSLAELNNYKDITVKARLTNPVETEKAVQSMNARFRGKDLQTDRYFETPKGKLKWREGTIENLITHYERFIEGGTERTIVYRYDLNPSKEMIDDLFENHKHIGTTKKERKIYQLDNIKIHLDKLPNSQEFIEIEAIDSENRFTIEELRNHCRMMKEKLGIADVDIVLTGYLKKP
jgi:adenylate cyclase class 2